MQALEDLFPGFGADLAAAGAVPYRVNLDLRFERAGFDPLPQRDFGWDAYAMTRPLIERTARARIERCANVTAREHCHIREIVMTADGGMVRAVKYETAERSETLAADLVIDASGRGDLTLAALTAAGRMLPAETTVGVDLSYASARFEIPDRAARDWQGVLTFPEPSHNGRFGILLPLENNCWSANVGGRFDDKPPGDADGFIAFARGLRTATIANAIDGAKRVSAIARFGHRVTIRRDFAQLEHFSRGLLPIGDAICRFNPMFGPGMSVAALEARLLKRLLVNGAADADPLAGLAPGFLRRSESAHRCPVEDDERI